MARTGCPQRALTVRLRSTRSGTTLGCANDIDTNSGGTITGVTRPAAGLSGGGSSGSVQLGLLTTFQLPQSCSNGQTAKYNTSTSDWSCSDVGAAYWAGSGLNLVGTTFSADFGTGTNQVARGSHDHFGQNWEALVHGMVSGWRTLIPHSTMPRGLTGSTREIRVRGGGNRVGE